MNEKPVEAKILTTEEEANLRPNPEVMPDTTPEIKVYTKTQDGQIKEPLKQAPAETKRVYHGDMQIDHDLYKLQAAPFLKNLSVDDNQAILDNVLHCHFFHSYDSSARKQTKCNFIGGHYHNMETGVDENGQLYAKCSPAIGTKRFKKTPKDAEWIEDKHVHETVYLRSDKVQKRTLNKDAQEYISKRNSYN